ncbi:uncharacterized protein LOC121990828 [Zingiber officinale]|uniref:uncharacterized protein LOC121990828 n=1 Tax=Zingiber officinale TaxID=94328 RepID=UPI001C4C6F4C|nr:uncharacterized protein LOC121990828 [Zingiber officinale]
MLHCSLSPSVISTLQHLPTLHNHHHHHHFDHLQKGLCKEVRSLISRHLLGISTLGHEGRTRGSSFDFTATNTATCQLIGFLALLDSMLRGEMAVDPQQTRATSFSPLLDRCSDGSYDDGKLHLRSDLDAVVSKLEFHINSFTEMNSSPNVKNSQAIILSKPGANASREDIKFYIKDLLSRLRIGDPIMRIQTLVALKEILVKDEKHVRIMTTEVNDAIDILVAFLEYKDAGVQEGAAGVLSVIAELNSHRGALVASGAIAPLIQVLEKSTELGKESSAKVLRKLTEKSDNGWSVSAHGGITALLKICVHPNSSKELVVLACQILKNLSSAEEMRRFMVEEGAIRVLLKLSNSIEEAHQIQAIELLQDLASGDRTASVA